jgi:hypothetical protein
MFRGNTTIEQQTGTSANHQNEDNDRILLTDDASIKDVNKDYNMPSGDPPTGFEQATFEHFIVPEEFTFW